MGEVQSGEVQLKSGERRIIEKASVSVHPVIYHKQGSTEFYTSSMIALPDRTAVLTAHSVSHISDPEEFGNLILISKYPNDFIMRLQDSPLFYGNPDSVDLTPHALMPDDFAIIRLPDNFPHIPIGSWKDPEVGQRVFAIGYPHLNPEYYELAEAEIFPGTVYTSNDHIGRMELDQKGIKLEGLSGGAVIGSDGKLLGMSFGQSKNLATIAFIDARTIIEKLSSLVD